MKSEDGDDDEFAQQENLRRTPRIKSDGDNVRKSRRFSTGLMPNKGVPMNKTSPLLKGKIGPAEEYNLRKQKLKE